MYQEIKRSMNDEERAVLGEVIAQSEPVTTLVATFKWGFFWFSGIVLCGVAAAFVISLGVHPVIGGVFGGLLGAVVILCLYAIIVMVTIFFHWSRRQSDFMREEVPKFQKALDDGKVFVKKVSAKAVIEIVEFEDEGPGYIYDVGDGRILFLKGQQYYPAKESMTWPNSDFEIVRTTHADLWVGIFCSGEKLIPVRELETAQCVDEIVMAECEEVHVDDIDRFARSITKVA